jgi:hypothetical protein
MKRRQATAVGVSPIGMRCDHVLCKAFIHWIVFKYIQFLDSSIQIPKPLP